MPPRRKQSIAEGIVVRARDLGEADRIVVMLTPERGLLSCVARSARKPGSKLGGQVDLLRHVLGIDVGRTIGPAHDHPSRDY